MNTLAIVNSVVFGLLFAIWNKSNMFNFVIKVLFLGLLVANILQATGK